MSVAAELSARQLDAVEIRLDAFSAAPSHASLSAIKLPKILTPRHPAEGGARKWNAEARERATVPLLSLAAALDLEAARIAETPNLLSEALDRKIPLIFSFHDFEKTPALSALRRSRDRAFASGATIFKVACRVEGASDLRSLLAFLEESIAVSQPVAVMGMGPLGIVSRLLFSACGSTLLYGWLHRPQVSGQLPALELRATLKKLLPGK